MNDFEGKTALVTGAGRRLGRHIALSLAGRGMNVILHFSKSQEDADQTANLARGKGVEAWPIQADFCDGDALSVFTDSCEKTAGPVEVLVNSASIYTEGTILASPDTQFIKHMSINALAPLALSRWFSTQCSRGSLINILDARMDDYDSDHVPYALSKQALHSLTRMLSIELAPGIRVNGVAPGLILPPPGRGDEYLKKRAHTNPLATWGDAGDVSEAVLYLIGAGFVTGQTIYVDGGRHLRGFTSDS
jgi:pteridine reductase